MAVFESVKQYLLFSREVSDYYNHVLTQAAAESRLSKPEGDVLLFFANSPQLDTARDACEYRGFSKAYVSKAVEGLCQRGFLRVTADGHDRRVQHLSVQPAAADAVAQLRRVQQQFFDDLNGGVTPEEEALLWSVLERMRENVQRASGKLAKP